MRKAGTIPAAVALIALLCAVAMAADFDELWVYMSPNFASDESTDAFITMMRTAKPAGVTHVNIKDPKLNYLHMMGPEYFANVERAKKVADELGLAIIPAIYPFGYSGGYLMHDPNLAAGLPARDVPFIVRGRDADADPAEAPQIVDASFEDVAEGQLAAWQVRVDSTGPMLDTKVKHSGAASLKFSPSVKPDTTTEPRRRERPNRPAQRLAVRPFKYYRLTFQARSESFEGEGEGIVNISSDGGRRRHCFTNLYIPATSDWTEYQVTFNTLEAEEIDLSIAVSPGAGAVWVDDVKIEPAGLANLLRTEMKPFVVKSADGKTVYEEGRDFKPVVDPVLGHTGPMGGPTPNIELFEPGPYDIWHKGPEIELTENSRIKDGDTILVSYFHPHFIYNDQYVVAMDEPKVFDIMEDQMKRVHALFNAPGYFMYYDEIRIAGWEIHPDGSNPTPGQILAKNVRHGVELARRYAPEAKLYVWSDMFTPFHNARPLGERGHYYLVDGDYTGSWEGLPSDVTIAQWAARNKEAMQWYAGRGHRQFLCGYYDDADMKGNIARWMRVSEGVPGVIGVMYTTWRNEYARLGEFFSLLKSWPAWEADVPVREGSRER